MPENLLDQLNNEQLERMAEAVHATYRRLEIDIAAAQKQSSRDAWNGEVLSLNYAELPEEFKEQNRAVVRSIYSKLVSAGYSVTVSDKSPILIDFSLEEVELMARMEHERWVRAKLEAGWTYGAVTDRASKQHVSIVPWDDLSSLEKEKDRRIVQAIPEILAAADFVVARM